LQQAEGGQNEQQAGGELDLAEHLEHPKEKRKVSRYGNR
jgi:hypothetical protein